MLNPDQLRRLVRLKSMPKYAQALSVAAEEYFPEYGIIHPKDVAAAWATFALEMDKFRTLEENLKYSPKRIRDVWPSRFSSIAKARPYAHNAQKLANKVYGGRYGNNTKNDGWMHRGSGPIMTTFLSNFEMVKTITGIDVVANPEILRTDPDVGMQAACIFWKHKKISRLANNEQLTGVRRTVSGGEYGLDDFKVYYYRALKMLLEEGYSGAPESGTVKTGDASEMPKAKETKPNPKSKILPLYRPKQSDAVTLAVLQKFGNQMPSKRATDKIKVLMVRGYYLNSMGRKGENDRAIYDDAIFVVSPEGIQSFNGNSDPSVYRKRVATIKAPQNIRYRPGLHGMSRKAGPYPAFRQDAHCTVVRDGVGDDTGMFYVNFHRGGVNGTSSLGCLTVPPHQWDEFYRLLKGLLDKHDQDNFYVTLVEYAGDNPPVTIPKNEQSKNGASNTAVGVAVVAGGLMVAVAEWFGGFSTWVGDLLKGILQ